jgi:hypothetical protein
MKRIILFSVLGLLSLSIFSNTINDSLYLAIQKGIKIPFDSQEKYFVKFGAYGQIWSRFMEMNPETTDFDGQAVNYDADILLRRGFFSTYIQLNNFTFFSMLAISSQPQTVSTNGSTPIQPQVFFYDNWGSYSLAKGKLIIGGGLNMYNGISRYSSASSARTLGADVPLIAAPNLTTTEQAARQLSFFITGNIKSFAYRFALAKPFISNTIPTTIEVDKVYHKSNHNFSYKGYVEYQFLDKESNRMPFKSATYLSQKKVFNIGMGFDIHHGATVSYNLAGESAIHDKKHIAADVFLDYPLKRGSALTFYASEFFFDYGPDFTQEFGVSDIYTKGISELQFGSGKATFIQMAYLLPSKIRAKRIQPFYELTSRNFEAVDKTLFHHNIGINYFVIGHKVKFTLQYENRPYYANNEVDRKSLVIGKMQFGI